MLLLYVYYYIPLLHTHSGARQQFIYNASAEGHSEVVKLLVQAGADLHGPTHRGTYTVVILYDHIFSLCHV